MQTLSLLSILSVQRLQYLSGSIERYRSSKGSLLTGSFVLAGMILAGGCGSHETESDGGGQSAFRIRSGFDSGLNVDEGWAGKVNESVAITADQPFRIRFEVEPLAAMDGMPFELQYGRNEGAWERVEAHDFPHPLRELDLDFEESPIGHLPKNWSIEKGTKENVRVAQEGNNKVLRVQARQGPQFITYPSPWEVTELAAEIKLSQENQSGAGLVFAYTDPQNFCRVFLDIADGKIRVSRTANGAEAIIAEEPATIPTGQWLSLEIDMEGDLAEINFQNDTLEFEAGMGTRTPSSQFGIYVPADCEADVRDIAIAGEARTPRVSIVSCPAFEHGGVTTNLIQNMRSPFQAGSGVESDEQTSPSSGGMAHSEYEWALVVRRFADRAISNENGDRFEFRMASADGASLDSSKNPVLKLNIPPGHLGGTFIESPGRIGPWQASNGDLYFIMEPTETDNLFMMLKSKDYGMTWREVDAANRPKTNDLEAVEGRQIGDTLYILHQVTESAHLHAFHTSDHPTRPDRWAFTDELAAVADSMAQADTLTVRSDGSMVAFYVGQTLHYNIRSAEGVWGEQVIIDPDAVAAAGPKAVVGAEDTVHVAYYRTDGTLWYRSLLKNGTLTAPQQLASGAGNSRAEYGAVLPLVYIPESETVVIIYRLDHGFLWERRVQKSGTITEGVRVSDRQVVTDAVDSQQAGADAIVDGETIYLLFIDEETRSLFSTHDRSGWKTATLQIGDILGSWVRGNIITRKDGVKVYGFVYDAGSDGGAGMNRYGAIEPSKL